MLQLVDLGVYVHGFNCGYMHEVIFYLCMFILESGAWGCTMEIYWKNKCYTHDAMLI